MPNANSTLALFVITLIKLNLFFQLIFTHWYNAFRLFDILYLVHLKLCKESFVCENSFRKVSIGIKLIGLLH